MIGSDCGLGGVRILVLEFVVLVLRYLMSKVKTSKTNDENMQNKIVAPVAAID